MGMGPAAGARERPGVVAGASWCLAGVCRLALVAGAPGRRARSRRAPLHADGRGPGAWRPHPGAASCSGNSSATIAGSPYTDQAKLLAARRLRRERVSSTRRRTSSSTRRRRIPRITSWRWWRACAWRACRSPRASPTPRSPPWTPPTPGAFAARYHEVRGDAYFAKGDKAAALSEYRGAPGPPMLGDAALLDLKIADLAADAPAASGRRRSRPRAPREVSHATPARPVWLLALLSVLAACSKDKVDR